MRTRRFAPRPRSRARSQDTGAFAGGAPSLTPFLQGGTAGALLEWTGPARVRAYMHRVDGEYQALGRDIGGSQRLPGTFLAAWWDQAAAWHTFFQENVDSWTLGPGEYNETESYERQLLQYRAQYQQLTGEKPSTPEPIPPAPDEPISKPLEAVVGVLKWGVIGYLVIQAVGALKHR